MRILPLLTLLISLGCASQDLNVLEQPVVVIDVTPQAPPTSWCEAYGRATPEERVEERINREPNDRARMVASGYIVNEFTEKCWVLFETKAAEAAVEYCESNPVRLPEFLEAVERAGSEAQVCYDKAMAEWADKAHGGS